MLRHFPLLLLLPAAALAQTPEVVAKVDAKLEAERSAQRAEDVEILRRLLNRAAGLPDQAATLPITAYDLRVANSMVQRTDAPKDKSLTFAPGPFDGVYLAGAGVVFTLHVPAGTPRTAHGERIGLNTSCGTCHQPQAHVAHTTTLSAATCTTCHSDAPKSPAPLSDWDRTKLDVRGEKPKTADPTPKKDEQPRAAVCEPGNLQTLVAGVLAANAKNVRHLGEKEGVTVVVTFDEVKSGAKGFEPVTETRLDSPQPLAAKPGFTADEFKGLALGDLHLKQGKFKEAADAYGKALARFADKQLKTTATPDLTAEQRNQFADEFQKVVRDAMKNYAKALLLADQPDKAKEALEMATGFVVLEVTPTTVPAKATGPAKLIVNVSRADIDGTKDAAVLKKRVTVERVNFPK